MIAVKIQSGLGNQLFQYAFAYALALKYETDLHVDPTFVNYYPSDPASAPTKYHLSRFKIEPSTFFRNTFLRNTHNILPKFLLKKIVFKSTQCKIDRHNLTVIIDDLSSGQEAFNSLHDDIYLDGYFQYPMLFAHLQEELKSLFTVPKPLQIDKYLRQIRNVSNPVAVNLRRRDYLRPRNASRHGVCNVDYYRQSILKIKELTTDPTFFVISDDIPDSRFFLQDIDEDFQFLNENQEKDILSDFYLMQQCKHLIIANSSYSWWSAYLHPALDKIIIAPKQWVVHKNWASYNETIIPPAWIRI